MDERMEGRRASDLSWNSVDLPAICAHIIDCSAVLAKQKRTEPRVVDACVEDLTRSAKGNWPARGKFDYVVSIGGMTAFLRCFQHTLVLLVLVIAQSVFRSTAF